MNTKLRRIHVHEVLHVYHHIGKKLHHALLGLYIDKRRTGVLDDIRKIAAYHRACLCHYLTRGDIHNILCQRVAGKTVAEG